MHQLSGLNEKRFFIECIADRDDEDSFDFLTQAIRKETDVRLIKSLLKAMTEFKSNKFAPYISDFLYSDDKELVALAVEALGACSTDLAIDAIINRAGADTSLDKLIVKTLKKIASEKTLSALVEFLGSNISSLRNGARQALAELKEVSIPHLLDTLKSKNSNLVIAALEAGIQDYLHKPFNKSGIEMVLKRYLK